VAEIVAPEQKNEEGPVPTYSSAGFNNDALLI